MTAYRRFYDSRHLQADCKEPGSAPEPYDRVWTFSIAVGRSDELVAMVGTYVE